MALAGEVLRVAAGLRTNVRKGERTWLPSLLGPGMTLTPWVAVEGHAAEQFGAVSADDSTRPDPVPNAGRGAAAARRAPA